MFGAGFNVLLKVQCYDLGQDKSFLYQCLEATLSTRVSWHQLGATTHRGFLRDLTDRLLLGQALANAELTFGCWLVLLDFHGTRAIIIEIFSSFLDCARDCKFASRPFERCYAKTIFLEKKLLVTSINFTSNRSVVIIGRGGFPGMHIY